MYWNYMLVMKIFELIYVCVGNTLPCVVKDGACLTYNVHMQRGKSGGREREIERKVGV
jgi:hypothetical protein